MCALEHTYKGLKELIVQRTTLQSRLDPSLLEKWVPVDMVLKYNHWTSMQLMLNQVADDNITDLFPTDWQPNSPLSTIQEKHFKVLTEVMTEMFIQCGLVKDKNVIEMTNYQDFLRVLHHHSVMGNIIHYPSHTFHYTDGVHVIMQAETLYRVPGRQTW